MGVADIMRNRAAKLIIIMSVLVMLLSWGCENGDKSGASDTPVEVGNAAPDFTAEMTDGSKITLSALKGKAVILNIWATWCGPCCEELPAFQKLYEEYGDKLQVIAVNYAESKKDVDSFVTEKGYTFPFAYDEKAQICGLYPSDGIPYTVVIDKKGNVRKTFMGAASAEKQYEIYKTAIDEVLNE